MIYSSNKKLGFTPELIGSISKEDWIKKYGNIVSRIELGQLYDKYLKPLQKKPIKKKDAGLNKSSGEDK